MKIMVIDDNEIVVRAISRMMRGHVVVQMTDPNVALASVRSGERLDLVLCDLKMPLMNGFDVLSEIDAWFEVDGPMLMLMTGDEEATASNTVSVLTKPFDRSKLEAAIALLAQTRAQRRVGRTARLPILHS